MPNSETNQSEPQEESNDVALRAVILAFINFLPKPTEDQIHALAGLLDLKFQEFETRMQEVLAPYLEDGYSFKKGIPKEIDVEDLDQLDTPLDTFLMAFYMLVPEPTERQLLILGVLVNLSPEELEEHTFMIMNRLLEAYPQGEDVDIEDVELDDHFEFDEAEPDDLDDLMEHGPTDIEDEPEDKAGRGVSTDDGEHDTNSTGPHNPADGYQH